jgi:DNA-binding YbaB/EbfC family protein
MTNLQNILKQAQKIQSQVSKMQAELGERRVEASAGGGMVTAVVNGRQELISLRIDPQVVDPGDVEMLEDLVVAAVSEALARAGELASEEMKRLTGGLPLPLVGD